MIKNSLLFYRGRTLLNTLGFSSIQLSLGRNIWFISSKISESLGILSRSRHFAPIDTFLSIYWIFDSALHNLWYCCMGTSCPNKPGQTTNLAKTCSSFNLFCSTPPHRSHAIPLFNHYSILPLNFQYYKSDCTNTRDVSNNPLPANISNLFLYSTQVHSYNTSFSATGTFNIKYSMARTNQFKHSFSIFGARIWNSIPQSIWILPKHKF